MNAQLLISESLTRFPKEKTTHGQIPSSHPLVNLFASRLVFKMIICALDELIPKPIPSALIRWPARSCLDAYTHRLHKRRVSRPSASSRQKQAQTVGRRGGECMAKGNASLRVT
jgi:hypothetical protein